MFFSSAQPIPSSTSRNFFQSLLNHTALTACQRRRGSVVISPVALGLLAACGGEGGGGSSATGGLTPLSPGDLDLYVAGGMIEGTKVYADENGDGQIDPTIDTLIGTTDGRGYLAVPQSYKGKVLLADLKGAVDLHESSYVSGGNVYTVSTKTSDSDSVISPLTTVLEAAQAADAQSASPLGPDAVATRLLSQLFGPNAAKLTAEDLYHFENYVPPTALDTDTALADKKDLISSMSARLRNYIDQLPDNTGFAEAARTILADGFDYNTLPNADHERAETFERFTGQPFALPALDLAGLEDLPIDIDPKDWGFFDPYDQNRGPGGSLVKIRIESIGDNQGGTPILRGVDGTEYVVGAEIDADDLSGLSIISMGEQATEAYIGYRVFDGTQWSDPETLNVAITLVNDAPIFDPSLAQLTMDENMVDVGVFTATDPEGATKLTYTLEGPDADALIYDPETGALQFKSAPDFESPADTDGDGIYQVTLVAADPEGAEGRIDVSIRINDINDPPVFPFPNSKLVQDENIRDFVTPTATDQDAGDEIRYSLGGRDAAAFKVDDITGQVRFWAIPNYEKPLDDDSDNIYHVTLIATDLAGATATHDIQIEVRNVEEDPVFQPVEYSFLVNENQASPIAQIIAQDDDGDALQYSVTGGDDLALFAINADTGELSFLQKPDFEAPQDANGDNVYRVIVTATDQTGRTSSQNLYISVANVEEAPKFPTNERTVTINENTFSVTQVVTTDQDADKTVSYRLEGDDATRFIIGERSGVIEFIRSPDFESPVDLDGNNIYELTVVATDGAGLESRQTLHVKVNDVSEQPDFVRVPDHVTVREGTQQVAQLQVVDPDLNDRLSFYLEGKDAGLFQISVSGEVTFIASPDFEQPRDWDRDGEYTFTVVVTDDDGNTQKHDMAVQVENVNEAPFFDGRTSQVFAVKENSFYVGQVTAIDPDAGDSLIYRLDGPDSILFTINEKTGDISFKEIPDFENVRTPYVLTVIATDESGERALHNITVHLTNENEPPVFSQPSVSVRFDEGQLNAMGNYADVGAFTARDPDGFALTYSLAGRDADKFTIDANLGVLSFLQPERVDFEGEQNQFEVIIVARDAMGLTAHQTVYISLNDVNEAPSFPKDLAHHYRVAEGTLAVGRLIANDPDANDGITYSINPNIGDGSLFTIGSATGQVSFRNPQDFEGGKQNFYFDVVASDKNGLTATHRVTVELTNTNEAPQIILEQTVFELSEGSGVDVATIRASDQDSNLKGFSISGRDADYFTITSAGRLQFNGSPDFEKPQDAGGNNIYDIDITAYDADGLSDTRSIQVKVLNVNEAPSFNAGLAHEYTVAESTTFVGMLGATDPDLNDRITYSLFGTGAENFSIDRDSGELRFKAAPDFETGPREFYFDVLATDVQNNQVKHSVHIVVANQNEAPEFTATQRVYRVVEGNVDVAQLSAIDPEGDPIRFSLSGKDADQFTISDSGYLTFSGLPNFEAPRDVGGDNVYDIDVTVMDDNGLSKTQSIQVRVDDLNEVPLFPRDLPVAYFVKEGTREVGVFAASQEDEGRDHITYTLDGADARFFTIDSHGKLAFIDVPDYETSQKTYSLIVKATDGANAVNNHGFTVSLIDENEAPIFQTTSLYTSVVEGSDWSMVSAATDPENDLFLRYRLAGADAGQFVIDPTSARITFAATPDFEDPKSADGDNLYSFKVIATDRQGLETEREINVQVTNANDAPTFPAGTPVSYKVSEGSRLVTTFQATDQDANDRISYFLDGLDAAKFTIDAQTGELSFRQAPDYETDPHNYSLIISAVDNAGKKVDHLISVQLTNVNEAPQFGEVQPVLSITEDMGVDVAQLLARDPELDALSFSLSGLDADQFVIGANGGLQFVGVPDYENPKDAGGNNVYDIDITVADTQGLSQTRSFKVSVTDVNEAPQFDKNLPTTFKVAEGTNVVGTFRPHQQDEATDYIAYELTGADQDVFDISSDGVLSFKQAPNFEIDQKTYTILITARDSKGAFDTHAVTVELTNVNENPFFTSPVLYTSVTEQNPDWYFDSEALDPDGAGALSYRLTGPDADRFKINSVTGRTSFIKTPNFEAPDDANGDGTYRITVVATDSGGLTGERDVHIQLAGLNEPPVFDSDMASRAYVTEGSLVVGRFTAQDPDADAKLTYSVEGYDADFFLIDQTSGDLRFSLPQDYETGKRFYYISVVASDGDLSTSHALSIEVTNVNEAPHFAETTVSELSSEAVLWSYSAVAVDPEVSALTYALSGPDADKFRINSTSGLIEQIKLADFENPDDADGNGVYQIEVTATDDKGLSARQDIYVTLVNANEMPYFPYSLGKNLYVDEGTKIVGDLHALDPDATDPLTYRLDGPGAPFFDVSSDGILEFKLAPDYEGGPTSYALTVYAKDAGGAEVGHQVVVNVNNVQEAPQFINIANYAPAPEYMPASPPWSHQINAQDPDGDSLSFSLTGPDADKLIISANGLLQFAVINDYEAPADANGDGVYFFTVNVDDGHGNRASEDMSVIAVNQNEAPHFATDHQTIFNVDENTLEVGKIMATDPDGAPDFVRYTLSGTDSAKFTISNAGVLSFANSPNFEGGQTRFFVTVTAQDTAHAVDDINLVINLQNVNEAPVFLLDQPSLLSVTEGERGRVGTIAVADVDGDPLQFKLSGPDKDAFVISSTGELRFVGVPDYDHPTDAGGDNFYNLTVTVTDPKGLTASRDFQVEVENVNEAPFFGSDVAHHYKVAEGTRDVGQLVATDPDTGDTLSYSFGLFPDRISPDAVYFTIDSTSGMLSFQNTPDFEGPKKNFIFEVVATDKSGSSVKHVVTVEVVNVNEAPRIAPGPNVFEIREGNAVDVATISATDPDNNFKGFALSGKDAAQFTINAGGKLQFLGAPDFEAPQDTGKNNVYDIDITAFDANGLSDTRSFQVKVTDVNEAPSFNPDITSAVYRIAEGTRFVDVFGATDPDADDSVIYSLAGYDKDIFSINPRTGEVRFAAPANFEENKKDFYFTVIAEDIMNQEVRHDVHVIVEDVNEAPSFIPGLPSLIEVAEGAGGDIAVLSAQVRDPEDNIKGFSVSGKDAGYFTISQSGFLRFVGDPDYENPQDSGANNIYDIDVTVFDEDGLTGTKAYQVKVNDVNESPTFLPDVPRTVRVDEGTLDVGTFAGFDPDHGLRGRLTYSVDNPAFVIDAQTGKLSFISPPDYETGPGVYRVLITAKDTEDVDANLYITVFINNVNDAPEFSATLPNTFRVEEGDTEVGTLVASDADGDRLTYSVDGIDAGLFTIDQAGKLSFVGKPDFENPDDTGKDNIYNLDVIATDPDGLSDTKTVQVTVTDKEFDINFVRGQVKDFTISEGEGTYVGKVTAINAGGEDFEYSIASPNSDANHFAIDPKTGELYVKGTLDYDNPADSDHDNVYGFYVYAGGPLGASLEATITVTELV